MQSEDDNTQRGLAERHLWEFRVIRDLVWVLIALGFFWLLYEARAIVIPIVIAFALAYAVDPMIRFAKHRAHVPRFASATILFLVALACMIVLVIWILPKFLTQLADLAARLPHYYSALAQKYDLPTIKDSEAALTSHPISHMNPPQLLREALSFTGRLFGFIGSVVSTATYLVMAGVLMLVLFVYFAARMDRLPRLKKYLPASHRERIGYLMTKIDLAFSGYVRGQLVVALFTTTGFCIGFWLANVPYWFVVSLVGGALSVIPYGQIVGPVSAIMLKYLETQAGGPAFTWVAVFVEPLIVYAITQTMETWVITPLVQGQAAKLNPVAVLVVLIVGGALGGILGLILAIPVTASARMIFEEELRPRIKRWAESH